MGIIPAYAGSTARASSGVIPVWDHPRIRGEHMHVYPPVSRFDGSSPHTRGARRAAQPPREFHGIIPAYAGSTVPAPRNPCRRRDHPRIRGEHHQLGMGIELAGGSSPHTRGALDGRAPAGHDHRIIPAYAGSTCRRGRACPCPSDHPRIRGEHHQEFAGEGVGLGSSPHTRGAQGASPFGVPRPRIIPAYAGSTAHREGGGPGRGDHPRIRGEHLVTRDQTLVVGGSSPHTRGALASRTCKPSWPRIIPAYAGSTKSSTSRSRSNPGSSPHTRGARALLVRAVRPTGIIPAYAGSTS